LSSSTWTGRVQNDLIWFADRIRAELANQTSASPEATRVKEIIDQLTSLAKNVHTPPINSRSLRQVFSHVVVKDLGKGVMSSNLLDALYSSQLVDAHTRWYIDSKVVFPPWLDHLATHAGRLGTIRLLLLPAALLRQQTVVQYDGRQIRRSIPNPLYCSTWFLRQRFPTQDALAAVGLALQKCGQDHHSLVVAMPSGLSLLAVERQPSGEVLSAFQPSPHQTDEEQDLTGKVSMFFSALTAHIIITEGFTDYNQLADALGKATILANRYVESEIRQLKSPAIHSTDTAQTPAIGMALKLSNDGVQTTDQLLPISRLEWQTAQQDWASALGHAETTTIGILPAPPGARHKTLDIWRTMVPLDGYVETVPRRKSDLSDLLRLLHETESDFTRIVSVRLLARPGSGKSHLVSCLHNTTKAHMDLLSFNITQLVRRENVIACFDHIASNQTHAKGRRLLVFFDEINAQLEGTSVYDLFLSVLEDGVYMRSGQKYKLNPCTWVFAGTHHQLSDEQPDKDPKFKESDFISRLTIPIIDLDIRRPEDIYAKTGFVYLGVAYLLRRHPDIRLVSDRVLRRLHALDPESTSNRDICNYIDAFHNIQFGQVLDQNVSPVLLERTSGILTTTAEQMIEIVSDPPGS
jgi:hypothetical protein